MIIFKTATSAAIKTPQVGVVIWPLTKAPKEYYSHTIGRIRVSIITNLRK